MQRSSKLNRLVRKRDRSICQCCYLSSEDVHIEVHHIQPLAMGGDDAVENMVCLCDRCHKRAPDDATKFLGYQRARGARGSELLGKFLSAPPSDFLCNSADEVITFFDRFMHELFLWAWWD
jgi:hypothetical protein